MTMEKKFFHIAAFYKFIQISETDLVAVRTAIENFCSANQIHGLAVMGREGVNATIAGSSEAIAQFKIFIVELLKVDEIQFKDSVAEKMPFARFKVDVRAEIITTKDETLLHTDSEGTHLSPREWHELLNSDPDVVLVDTRNFYETEIGIFEKAIDPKLTKFSDFERFVEREALPHDKKLLLYCTGGIRCEKAVPEMKRLGYQNVFQLEGGILRYLEEFPNGHFKGECFVFDHRVAVDQNLEASKTYKLCPHCGNPAKESVNCTECGTAAIVCSGCLERADRHSCSKNCAYHLRRKSAAVSIAG